MCIRDRYQRRVRGTFCMLHAREEHCDADIQPFWGESSSLAPPSANKSCTEVKSPHTRRRRRLSAVRQIELTALLIGKRPFMFMSRQGHDRHGTICSSANTTPRESFGAATVNALGAHPTSNSQGVGGDREDDANTTRVHETSDRALARGEDIPDVTRVFGDESWADMLDASPPTAGETLGSRPPSQPSWNEEAPMWEPKARWDEEALELALGLRAHGCERLECGGRVGVRVMRSRKSSLDCVDPNWG
eukprot:TRINITY_DN1270_c0_g1_i1.p1 TRINITY_DN1270_c0_g1~~TRINITY_DN1270_c0_g1_i1.p1  ORF type:complete len:248 (+),score=19.20 TRINITY_DN1270_c0_g1_i1:172-915(+)